MASTNVDDQVRRAWQQQRAGDSRAAVDAFAQIVKNHPQDIDARYGLGLSQKSAGNPDEAGQQLPQRLAARRSGSAG